MPTVAGTINVNAQIQYKNQLTVTGGAVATQGPETQSFTRSEDASVLTEVELAQYTIAASGNQTVDFHAITSVFGASATNTKIRNLFIKATAASAGAVLKIEQGASNDIAWFLKGVAGSGGTAPYIELQVGSDGTGCCLMICDGLVKTISGSACNLKFENTGSVSLTLKITAHVGA